MRKPEKQPIGTLLDKKSRELHDVACNEVIEQTVIFSTDFHRWPSGQACTDTLCEFWLWLWNAVLHREPKCIQGTSEDDGSRDEELSFTTLTSAMGLTSNASIDELC